MLGMHLQIAIKISIYCLSYFTKVCYNPNHLITDRRHLLRLWLRDEENGWKIPQKLQKGLGRTWDSLRYEAASDNHRFPLNPEVKLE